MAYINFRLKTDYEVTKENLGKIGEEVIRRVLNMRIESNKPCITFIGGDSGEGKSLGVLRINEVAFIEEIEKDPELFLQHQVIYTPFEYPRKFKWILFDKDAKGRKVMIFMEARELVKAKMWYTVVNQAISDVNAMSRTVKPLAFTMVSQDITDIDKELRRTINFYGWCLRPFRYHTKLYFYTVYKTRNIENSKIMQKRLHGMIFTPTKSEHVQIDKFVLNLPKKEMRNRFEQLDFEAKSEIILRKLDMLEKLLQLELPKLTKLETLIETVIKDPTILQFVLSRNNKTGKLKVKPQFITLYNMTSEEGKDFEKNLILRLKGSGMMAEEKTVDQLEIEAEQPAEPTNSNLTKEIS